MGSIGSLGVCAIGSSESAHESRQTAGRTRLARNRKVETGCLLTRRPLTLGERHAGVSSRSAEYRTVAYRQTSGVSGCAAVTSCPIPPWHERRQESVFALTVLSCCGTILRNEEPDCRPARRRKGRQSGARVPRSSVSPPFELARLTQDPRFSLRGVDGVRQCARSRADPTLTRLAYAPAVSAYSDAPTCWRWNVRRPPATIQS